MTAETTASIAHAQPLSKPALGESPTAISLSIVGALVLLIVPVISYSSMWHNFYFYRDDYGQIYNSLRQYHFMPLEWFTQGFRDYFINYPEFTGQVTNLIRPLVNITLMIEGEFFNGENHGIFLATNHILFVVNGMLALAVIRLLTRLPLTWCLFGLALFALSPAWTETFWAPSFRTGQLMMLFSLISFIAIATATAVNWRSRLLIAVACQCVSLFGHEIGIVGAPAAAVVWYLIAKRDGIRAPLYSYALFLIPIGFLLLVRMGVMDGDPFGIYVFGEYSAAEAAGAKTGADFLLPLLGNVLSSLKMAAFPIFMFLEPVTVLGSGDAVDIGFLVALLIFNAAAVVLLVYIGLRKDTRSRTYLALAAAFIVSMGPAAFLAPQPRFAVIPMVFVACLWSMAAAHVYRLASVRGSGRFALALLMLPIVVTAAHFGWLAWRNTTYFAENRDLMASHYNALREAAADPAIDELIFVNDFYGRFSALAMLRMAATDAGRPDLPVRVVNSVDGPFNAGMTGTYASGQCTEGTLALDARLGAWQSLFFPNATVEKMAETKDGPVVYDFQVRWQHKLPARILNALGMPRPADEMVMTGKQWSFRYDMAGATPAIVVVSPVDGATETVTDCAGGFALTH